MFNNSVDGRHSLTASQTYKGSRQKIADSIQKSSLGRNYLTPAEKPSAFTQSAKMARDLARLSASKGNIEIARSIFEQANSSLEECEKVLNQLTEIVSQAASNSDENTRVANQYVVDALQAHLKEIVKHTKTQGMGLLDGSLSSGAKISSSDNKSNMHFSVDSGLTITANTLDTTAAVSRVEQITVASVAEGDRVAINGVDFVFRSALTGAKNEVLIGTGATADLDTGRNLVQAIRNYKDDRLSSFAIDHGATADIVTITRLAKGISGNVAGGEVFATSSNSTRLATAVNTAGTDGMFDMVNLVNNTDFVGNISGIQLGRICIGTEAASNARNFGIDALDKYVGNSGLTVAQIGVAITGKIHEFRTNAGGIAYGTAITGTPLTTLQNNLLSAFGVGSGVKQLIADVLATPNVVDNSAGDAAALATNVAAAMAGAPGTAVATNAGFDTAAVYKFEMGGKNYEGMIFTAAGSGGYGTIASNKLFVKEVNGTDRFTINLASGNTSTISNATEANAFAGVLNTELAKVTFSQERWIDIDTSAGFISSGGAHIGSLSGMKMSMIGTAFEGLSVDEVSISKQSNGELKILMNVDGTEYSYSGLFTNDMANKNQVLTLSNPADSNNKIKLYLGKDVQLDMSSAVKREAIVSALKGMFGSGQSIKFIAGENVDDVFEAKIGNASYDSLLVIDGVKKVIDISDVNHAIESVKTLEKVGEKLTAIRAEVGAYLRRIGSKAESNDSTILTIQSTYAAMTEVDAAKEKETIARLSSSIKSTFSSLMQWNRVQEEIEQMLRQ